MTAVTDVVTSALVQDRRRVGAPLRGELAGIWSARQGTYRILYWLVEQPHEVVVLRIEPRRDDYRTRERSSSTGRARRVARAPTGSRDRGKW